MVQDDIVFLARKGPWGHGRTSRRRYRGGGGWQQGICERGVQSRKAAVQTIGLILSQCAHNVLMQGNGTHKLLSGGSLESRAPALHASHVEHFLLPHLHF